MQKNPNRQPEEEFVKTQITHVWRHNHSGLYVYEDETECFNGWFASEMDAKLALREYCNDVLRSKYE